MTKIFSKEDVIEIPFPHAKARGYLKRLGFSSWEKLTTENKKKIFLWAIKDFLKGSLSIDALAVISGNMWGSLPADRSSDLANALYKCGELNFYSRIITKENPGNFTWFMAEVMEYYDKYKFELDTFPTQKTKK